MDVLLVCTIELSLGLAVFAMAGRVISGLLLRRHATGRLSVTWADAAFVALIVASGTYALGLLLLRWGYSEYEYCSWGRTGEPPEIASPDAEFLSYERSFLPLGSECRWGDGFVEQTVPPWLNGVLLASLLAAALAATLAVSASRRARAGSAGSAGSGGPTAPPAARAQ
ncbi:hypothetical protein ACTWP5_18305 [Streptomyces sp. 4N509B]|uniref:hypothetical protein n=1 Tax=Streptomyces sp. 4N509B TaxID=3457413 RepID=UPI003FD5560F